MHSFSELKRTNNVSTSKWQPFDDENRIKILLKTSDIIMCIQKDPPSCPLFHRNSISLLQRKKKKKWKNERQKWNRENDVLLKRQSETWDVCLSKGINRFPSFFFNYSMSCSVSLVLTANWVFCIIFFYMCTLWVSGVCVRVLVLINNFCYMGLKIQTMQRFDLAKRIEQQQENEKKLWKSFHSFAPHHSRLSVHEINIKLFPAFFSCFFSLLLS